MERALIVLLSSLLVYRAELLEVRSAQNFRRVGEKYPLYRSAHLDALSKEDAALLEAVVLFDLRNEDEARKRPKSEAAQSLAPRPVPLLKNVNAFWDALVLEMPLSQKLIPTVATLWNGSALDTALTSYLEQGRHQTLYRGILQSGAKRIGYLLSEISHACAQGKSVVFYCQKGKDRTGLVAALIESILDYQPDLIVSQYAQSGPLLGGNEDMSALDDATSSSFVRSSPTDVDWSLFRGSPASAMKDTLDWISLTYGGIDAYLENACGFSRTQQLQLRKCLLEEK